MSKTTLFVSGFSARTRARDLAYEFERYGSLVRCDIPALRSDSSKPYAFVEFEDDRDARDAYNEMRDTRFEGYRLNIQFAKNAPSASWRYERGGGDPPRRGRSRSPPRRGRSPPRRRSPARRRSPSPPPRRRSPSPRRGRSPSPRRRSPSPGARPAVSDRRGSASRSPLRGDDRKDRDISPADRPRQSRSPEPVTSAMETEDRGRSRSISPRRSMSPRPRSVTP